MSGQVSTRVDLVDSAADKNGPGRFDGNHPAGTRGGLTATLKDGRGNVFSDGANRRDNSISFNFDRQMSPTMLVWKEGGYTLKSTDAFASDLATAIRDHVEFIDRLERQAVPAVIPDIMGAIDRPPSGTIHCETHCAPSGHGLPFGPDVARTTASKTRGNAL